MKRQLFKHMALCISALLLLGVAALTTTPVMAASTTIYLAPSNNIYTTNTANVGTLFNVSVWVSNAPDLGGANIKMYFNDSIINVTQWSAPMSNSSYIFYGLSGGSTALPSPPDPGYKHLSAGRGSVEVAVAKGELPPRAPWGHSGLICIFEFNITAVPAAPGTMLNCSLNINSPGTFLLDPTGSNIPGVILQDGYYEISKPGLPPPTFTLTIAASAGGSTNPAPGLYSYSQGSIVSVQANPNIGYYLDHWELDTANVGSANPYSVTMDGNHTLNALFQSTQSSMTVDPPVIRDLTMGPSSTFYVNITLAKVSNLAICTFNLTYDPQVLNWIGIQLFRVEGQYPLANLVIHNTGSVWVNLNYSTPINADPPVPMVQMHFHVNAYGITPLNLTDIQLTDSDGNPITCTGYNGLFQNIIRDVAVTNVVPTASWVYQGFSDNINVTAANLGNVSETFDVSAWYNTSLIGTVTITSLAPNAQTTVTIPWDTTGVPQGNYTITGTASTVPYETNTTNNVYVDGIVQVLTVVHDVAITNVVPEYSWIYQSWPDNISVTAANLGNLSETFDVTAYYNGNTIGTITVLSLASNSSTILTFNWNTTGLAEDNYSIAAYASPVPYEYNLTNNYLADGKVQVFTHIRDVAITGIALGNTWVYQGWLTNITVTASNVGVITESFNVTCYYDGSAIGTYNVINLTSSSSLNITFNWNTTTATPNQTYTISAQASIVPYEYNTTNNILVDGTVQVRIVGDVNGDGSVNLKDLYAVQLAFGSYGPNYLYPGSPPSANWNPYADINNDNVVNLKDVYLVEMNFGA
jgi:hypothetical protein